MPFRSVSGIEPRCALRKSHCVCLEIAIYSRTVNARNPLVRHVELFFLTLAVCLWAGCQSTNSGARSDKSLEGLRAKAESGNLRAQYELGQIYATGEGVPRNDAEALTWLTRAAASGHADAQYNLGLMYKDGRGTERNFVEAYKWLSLSAARGNPNAEVRLDTVARFMNREQIAEGQREAMNFKLEKPVAKAAPQPVAKPSKKPPKHADQKLQPETVFAPIPQASQLATNREPIAVTKPAAIDSLVEKPKQKLRKQPTEKTVEKSARKAAKEPVFSPVPPPSAPVTNREPVVAAGAAPENLTTAETPAPPAVQPAKANVEKPAKSWWGRKSKPEPVYLPVPP